MQAPLPSHSRSENLGRGQPHRLQLNSLSEVSQIEYFPLCYSFDLGFAPRLRRDLRGCWKDIQFEEEESCLDRQEQESGLFRSNLFQLEQIPVGLHCRETRHESLQEDLHPQKLSFQPEAAFDWAALLLTAAQ